MDQKTPSLPRKSSVSKTRVSSIAFDQAISWAVGMLIVEDARE
jgi:hypothetical protein